VEDVIMASHLYRIAQEAVTNAIKHGRAGKIQISLTRTPRRIRLAIRDNGTGMPVRQRSRGMGLHVMRYRAGIIGGTLAIEKRPGGGTTVVCTARPPYSSNESAQTQ
jgi:two-component system CheB/CheR fusion protein